MSITKIDKELLYLQPYYEAAIPLLGDSIKHIRASKSKKRDTDGYIDYVTKTIAIVNPHKRTFEDVLHIFAHELAHTKFPEHTTNHFLLMTQILQVFACTMWRLNIRFYE